MTFAVVRRVPRRAAVRVAVLLAAVFAFAVAVAGAAPLGEIAEFAAPSTDPAQVQAGSDGNLWFSDRNWCGRSGDSGWGDQQVHAPG